MAEQNVTNVITDPVTGVQNTLNAGVSNTSGGLNAAGTAVQDGVGVVVNGTLTQAVSVEAVPGLFHTPFDNTVTIQGYPDTVINQMTRMMGYRQIKSMWFDHFSIDQRKSADYVAGSAPVTLSNPVGTKVPKGTLSGSAVNRVITIPVADVAAFDESDQILFKGVPGYLNGETTSKLYFLAGYVAKVKNSSSEIDVVITNGPKDTSTNTVSIAVGTEILILGHALAEEDAHVPAAQSIPAPTEQFMQKFMTMASVTNVWLDAEKNVNWGLADIKESVSREFLLEIEKTYLFGHKAYFQDPETRRMIRTTGGLFEQLLEEGVGVLEIWKDDLTDESIISSMSSIFVGNRGSERRYMLTGMDFATALFSLESMQKQVNTNATKRQFTYDWNEWKLFNYTIQNKPYSLFDMLGFGNIAFVFDKANIERCVFRPMEEDMLDLMKLQIEDSKTIRCCEISSIVLKYAKCHRLIIMHDGTQQNNPTGANDRVRLAA